MKKYLTLFLMLGIMLSFTTACSAKKKENRRQVVSNGIKIGVSMPSKILQRWNQDAKNMKEGLEKEGFIVDMRIAEDDVLNQIHQIDAMIADDVKVLVIAAIDGTKLVDVLKKAKEKEIPVIAYDRLIMNTDALFCYATFNNFRVGVIQGRYIENILKLRKGKGPFNIEIFSGDTSDNNASFYFKGAMSILEPYINEGKLIVRSGRKEYVECSVKGWSSEKSQKTMEDILNKYYSNGEKLHAVLSPNDSMAVGITNALRSRYSFDQFPIITGQDCDIQSVKNILEGSQSMSIFKDTRLLADEVVKMVVSIVNRQAISVNDTETYNNGTGIVPAILLDPLYVDKRNYKQLLIDSGYYTRDQIME